MNTLFAKAIGRKVGIGAVAGESSGKHGRPVSWVSVPSALTTHVALGEPLHFFSPSSWNDTGHNSRRCLEGETSSCTSRAGLPTLHVAPNVGQSVSWVRYFITML